MHICIYIFLVRTNPYKTFGDGFLSLKTSPQYFGKEKPSLKNTINADLSLPEMFFI